MDYLLKNTNSKIKLILQQMSTKCCNSYNISIFINMAYTLHYSNSTNTEKINSQTYFIKKIKLE